MAELQDMYTAEHPEVKRAQRVVQKINQQIADRVAGILEGLKVKIAAIRAKVDSLHMEIVARRDLEVSRAIELRPYFEAQRELENLRLMRERVQLRLLQEEVDAALPKRSDQR